MRQSLDYLIRRFTFSVITLCVILVFNFFLFHIIPGDPAQMLVTPQMTIESREKIRHEFGLDKPLWFNVQAVRKTGEVGEIFDSQFFYYAKNLLKGNLGESFRQKRPVVEILADRIGPTFLVIVAGEIIAIIFGTFAGMIAALTCPHNMYQLLCYTSKLKL